MTPPKVIYKIISLDDRGRDGGPDLYHLGVFYFKNMEVEELKKMTEEEIFDFIRLVLIKPDAKSLKDHYRFEMSGYENETGQCTIHNQYVLNKFAFLGIYDYSNFLCLDFYKGSVNLHYQDFYMGDYDFVNLSGLGTTGIIHEVLKLTVFSNKIARRR